MAQRSSYSETRERIPKRKLEFRTSERIAADIINVAKAGKITRYQLVKNASINGGWGQNYIDFCVYQKLITSSYDEDGFHVFSATARGLEFVEILDSLEGFVK